MSLPRNHPDKRHWRFHLDWLDGVVGQIHLRPDHSLALTLISDVHRETLVARDKLLIDDVVTLCRSGDFGVSPKAERHLRYGFLAGNDAEVIALYFRLAV